LYHRLNEFKIQLAPLRERKEDILFFAEYFLQKANQLLNKSVKSFSAEVQSYLSNYYWHGNLRELNNVIRRAVLLTAGDEVQADSLPQEIVQSGGSPSEGGILEQNVGLLKSISWTAERQGIIEALEKVNYNKSKAADLLSIDRKTLYNKLKLYNITA
jgi:two-component system response regulator HydG